MKREDFYLLEAAYDIPAVRGDTTPVQFAYQTFPKTVVVAFAGSDTCKDWVYNLAVYNLDMKWASGMMHHGFALMYEDILPKVADVVRGKRALFVGHSSGGVMAIMCAAKFQGIARTIGTPNFCDPIMAKVIEERAEWITNYKFSKDLVTKLPFFLTRPKTTEYTLFSKRHQHSLKSYLRYFEKENLFF